MCEVYVSEYGSFCKMVFFPMNCEQKPKTEGLRIRTMCNIIYILKSTYHVPGTWDRCWCEHPVASENSCF